MFGLNSWRPGNVLVNVFVFAVRLDRGELGGGDGEAPVFRHRDEKSRRPSGLTFS